MDGKWDDIDLFRNSGAKISLPYVTISRVGSINLSAGFLHYAENQIDSCGYVELRYSKINNAILFKFTNVATDKITIKLTRPSAAKNGSIAAKSFLSYYNITVTGRFIAKLEEIPQLGKLWVIYLNEQEKGAST